MSVLTYHEISNETKDLFKRLEEDGIIHPVKIYYPRRREYVEVEHVFDYGKCDKVSLFEVDRREKSLTEAFEKSVRESDWYTDEERKDVIENNRKCDPHFMPVHESANGGVNWTLNYATDDMVALAASRHFKDEKIEFMADTEGTVNIHAVLKDGKMDENLIRTYHASSIEVLVDNWKSPEEVKTMNDDYNGSVIVKDFSGDRLFENELYGREISGFVYDATRRTFSGCKIKLDKDFAVDFTLADADTGYKRSIKFTGADIEKPEFKERFESFVSELGSYKGLGKKFQDSLSCVRSKYYLDNNRYDILEPVPVNKTEIEIASLGDTVLGVMKMNSENHFPDTAFFQDKAEMDEALTKLMGKDSCSLKDCKELSLKYFVGGVDNVTEVDIGLNDGKAFAEFVAKVDDPEIAKMFTACYDGFQKKLEKDRGVEVMLNFGKNKSLDRSKDGRNV